MPADVKTALPAMDWQIGDTITVTCDDPGAVITQLVIRVEQRAPLGAVPAPDALLAHLPTNA
jgi:hypothetical protein